MSDKPIIDDPPTDAPSSSETWAMPEPVFRSTEGHTPATAKSAYNAFEDTTEIANVNDSAFAKPLPNAVIDAGADPAPDTDPGLTKTSPDDIDTEEPHTESKASGGCAGSILFTVGIIGIFVAAAIVAVVYYLFYYSPVETGTF